MNRDRNLGENELGDTLGYGPVVLLVLAAVFRQGIKAVASLELALHNKGVQMFLGLDYCGVGILVIRIKYRADCLGV
ncbi:MAG: hypothetical protein A4E65_00092 [Syntrophorhabdus sp. PtaU1.Bin153]|nr:MAG: hypothetical protein A4E65_00092 [Syntrophorhabdus sp. PtaU1.Bin153]